jgi:hypothetical protein
MDMGKGLSESLLVHNREGDSDLSDLVDESQAKRLKTDNDQRVDEVKGEHSSSEPLVNGKSTYISDKSFLKSLHVIILPIGNSFHHTHFLISARC